MATKEKKEINPAVILVSISLVVMGGVLSMIRGLEHLPTYVQATLTSTKKPEHPSFTKYDQLLKTFVHDGQVDYLKMRESQLLTEAMSEMAQNSPDNFKKIDEIASYWMNAHNLVVLKIICEDYPVPNPLKLKREFITRTYVVGGHATTAEDIYTEKLHPMLVAKGKDASIPSDVIFLLCRGVRGYPAITDHALTDKTIRDDAKKNVTTFLHNGDNFDYRPNDYYFGISKFFQFYRDVFAQGYEDPWAYAIYYFDPDNEVYFDLKLEKKFLPKFDWSINDINR